MNVRPTFDLSPFFDTSVSSLSQVNESGSAGRESARCRGLGHSGPDPVPLHLTCHHLLASPSSALQHVHVVRLIRVEGQVNLSSRPAKNFQLRKKGTGQMLGASI